MGPKNSSFACALPVGTTKFLWLLAGPQRQATNDPKFNAALKAAGPQDQAIYDAIAKNFNDTFQVKEPK